MGRALFRAAVCSTLAASLTATTASAAELPSKDYPLVMTADESAYRVCVVVPEPSHGDCEPEDAERAVHARSALPKYMSFAGLAVLRRRADGARVTVTVFDYPGEVPATVGAHKEVIAGMLEDLPKGTPQPLISRVGTSDSAVGIHIRSARDMQGVHVTSYTFFGRKSVYGFVFAGIEPAVVDEVADSFAGRVSPTATFRKASSVDVADGIGSALRQLIWPVVGVIVVGFEALRRRRAQQRARTVASRGSEWWAED